MVDFVLDHLQILLIIQWIQTRNELLQPLNRVDLKIPIFWSKGYFECLNLDSINHLLKHETVFIMHSDGAVFGLEEVWASPQLDLVILQDSHAINFFRTDNNTWRDTHLLIPKLLTTLDII